MEKDQGDILIPGPMLPNGRRACLRQSADGTTLQPLELTTRDDPCESDGYIETQPLGAGRHRITYEIKYTQRGPARVTSAAYRSGWDSTYASKPS